MNINKIVAAKLKELRLAKNITVEAMAKELGISKTALSQLENGHVEITLKRMDSIANFLNIPLADIIQSCYPTSQEKNDLENIIPEEKLQKIMHIIIDAVNKLKTNN